MPTGTRTDYVYGNDGELVSETVVFDDGEATFGLTEDGMLTWAESKENAGKDMLFEKISGVSPDEDALDQGEEFEPMPEAAAAFEGVWQCGPATIDMFWEELGFKVLVQVNGNANEVAEWEYTCYYHEDDNTVVALPFGIHAVRSYNENGEFVAYNELYTGGEATFALTENGMLTWTDEKENCGEGMLFEKIADEPFGDDFEDESVPMPEKAAAFEGEWQCDRATIEMYWEELGFKVLVEWSSSAWETDEWEYSCYYHEEDNTVVAVPFGTHAQVKYNDEGAVIEHTELYDDGMAVFSLTKDGFLTWNDEKDNAGEGMLFTKLPE